MYIPIHQDHSSFALVRIVLGGIAPTEPAALDPVGDIAAWLEGTEVCPLHYVTGSGGAHLCSRPAIRSPIRCVCLVAPVHPAAE
jgi:pimeloyl-ACP methyl ester carboxylesterase